MRAVSIESRSGSVDGLPPKPFSKPFLQQELPVWRPRLSLRWVVCSLFGVGVLFLCLGAPIVKSSNDAVQQTVRYDNLPDCEAAAGGGTCTVDMTVEEDMDAPVFLYYKLTNFHQNHRRYVKSRSDPQLRGESVSDRELTDCNPLAKYGDGYGGTNGSLDGLYLYPCGLVANSMFTDTITATSVRRRDGGGGFEALGDAYTERGIAWPTDLGKKFNPQRVDPARFTGESPRGFTLPPVDDEHFVVWMRSATEPTFAKLYGRLPDTSLRKGDVLRLTVTNSFPTSFFGDGSKSVVLSKTTWVGTHDPFLGPAFLFYAFVCFALAGTFVWRAHYLSSRKLQLDGRPALPFERPFAGAGSTGAPSVLEADVRRIS